MVMTRARDRFFLLLFFYFFFFFLFYFATASFFGAFLFWTATKTSDPVRGEEQLRRAYRQQSTTRPSTTTPLALPVRLFDLAATTRTKLD